MQFGNMFACLGAMTNTDAQATAPAASADSKTL
jgi:hypothetical protein